MIIYFKRHLKVDFNWNKYCTSKEFNIACQKYDTEPIIDNDIEHYEFVIEKVYISSLTRTEQTLKVLKINKPFEKLSELNEVPIKAFTKTTIKIPTSIWMAIGRIQWLINSNKQPETRAETNARIELFIEKIEKENKNTLIIGHGFYFSQLRRKLIEKGFKTERKRILNNGQVVEFYK